VIKSTLILKHLLKLYPFLLALPKNIIHTCGKHPSLFVIIAKKFYDIDPMADFGVICLKN
jgi:hypothetical protein